MPRLQLVHVSSDDDLREVRALFVEYGRSLDFDLCFQGFDRELAELPGRYAPPSGRLLLVRVEGVAAGCVALRKLDEGVCEMKRLFVRPERHRRGIGRLLVDAIIGEARAASYGTMRLDTVSTMAAAISLYSSVGFEDITPYTENPIPGARFMELRLG